MFSTLLRLAVGLYALRIVSAQTPPDFTPAISNHLTVTYGTVAINPAGITVPASELQVAPSLGLAGTHSGSYVVIMMDFSVEANGPTAPNTTLIHWILTGLSSPNDTTTLTSHQGEIATYFPPGPPPGQSHTYGVFLYAEPRDLAIPADYVPFFANLTASPYNRIGFNLTHFVAETGLGKPVAADWFLVSTPNTPSSSTVATGTATATATITATGAGATSGSGSASSTAATPLPTVSKSGATELVVEMTVVALAGVGLALNFL